LAKPAKVSSIRVNGKELGHDEAETLCREFNICFTGSDRWKELAKF